METLGKNVLWVTRVLFNRANQVAGFYTVFETPDGKENLVRVSGLAGGVEILPHTEELERFFR
jgi:hypothetical protein